VIYGACDVDCAVRRSPDYLIGKKERRTTMTSINVSNMRGERPVKGIKIAFCKVKHHEPFDVLALQQQPVV